MTPKLYTALRWGALLGGPLAILETLLYLVSLRVDDFSAALSSGGSPVGPGDLFVLISSVAWLLELLLEAVVPLLAGRWAARQTGDPASGLIAGLTTGLLVAGVNMISEIVVPIDPFLIHLGLPAASGADAFANALVTRLMTIGMGAAFGWLGARNAQPAAPGRTPPG